MNISSKLIENAVQEFSRLPGIGKKTALRLVLHLLKQPTEEVNFFTEAIHRLRHEIRFCVHCHNVSDGEVCGICADPRRDDSLLCVVESLREVIAIESTQQYRGRYHVLGGLISPMDGIGPEKLHIFSLLERLKAPDSSVKELIMALSPTMEGDTTIFYITRQLEGGDLRISTLSRGVAFGGELEYVDELTLARSIASRLPFEQYLSKTD